MFAELGSCDRPSGHRMWPHHRVMDSPQRKGLSVSYLDFCDFTHLTHAPTSSWLGFVSVVLSPRTALRCQLEDAPWVKVSWV